MRVMITGGGTGGHVYPALAIAQAIRGLAPHSQLMYVGSLRGLERDLVRGDVFSHREFLDVSGLMRKHPREVLQGLFKAGRAWWRARSLVRQFRPHAVVGTGGYVSGPVVLAAARAGVPVILQEQNAYPGVTNRWLSRWATHVCLAFAAAAPHFPRARSLQVTGNPLRLEFTAMSREEARQQLGIAPQEVLLLVTGGSHGAKAIAQLAVQLLRSPDWNAQVKVLLGTGRHYYDYVRQELAQSGIGVEENGNIMVQPYIHQMHVAMWAADLALCRAGAVTVSELAVAELPSVLIPSSNVAHNEQEYNARVLADAGAAIMITEEYGSVSEQAVPLILQLLADRDRLAVMQQRSREQAKPQAAATIAQLVLDSARAR